MANTQNVSCFWGYNDRIIWKRITFLGYSFHRWNVCGAYAIRPYRVTRKRIVFLRYNDLIIWKRITFLGYSFHRWNVLGAYAIRPCRVTGKRIAFSGYNDLIIWKRITFLGCSFHRWNVLGAYTIRPYRVTGKRVDFLGFHVGAYCIRPTGRYPKDGKCAKRGTFSISIMYPASFPGLGRGLDFLLPSFLVSRQEKKVEARWIRPTEDQFNDDEYAKRTTFWGNNDRIIWKRTTFLGYSFHRWNVCGAYAIRPYRVTGKRITFSGYNDLIIQKRITFWIFIFDEWWKRDSFSGYNNHIIRKRITFFGYIDLVV